MQKALRKRKKAIQNSEYRIAPGLLPLPTYHSLADDDAGMAFSSESLGQLPSYTSSFSPAGGSEHGVCDAHRRQDSGDIMHAHDVGATQD